MGAPRIPRTFWIYLASRFCAATSMTLLRAAVAWHVFAITGSAFYLGLVGLVQFVPALTLTLLGGVVADAYDRRTIMRLAQIPMIACGALLYFATERAEVSLPLLYAAIFCISVSFSFDSPARQALVPSLVPLEVFPRAITFSATAQALAFASGPAIGGLLIASGGVGAAYAAYGVLVAMNLVGLGFVRTVREAPERRAPSWRAVREGIAFVRKSPMIWGCMTLDMFAVIFGGATALLPIFATDILHVGARGYGLLSSSLELGAFSSALVMMLRPTTVKAGRALLAAVAVYGIATIVFGLSRAFPLSVAAYMIAGMADQVSVVMRQTTIQLLTPDELRGRVSAVNMIAIGASNQLGAVESGFVAAATSAPFAVVSGGVGCLVVLAIVAWRVPELWRYRFAHSPA
ncbi:MAG: MFS transporter [Proteobacteria bacterium]|nr:MFS transporter [Pseudomonadota bacterium]